MPRGIYIRKPKPVTPYSLRQLQPGEPLPAWAPRRYADRDGYIRLRWKVGTRSYVEIREHQAVAGYVADMEVHHKDHNPANNDPSNLVVLTPAEHDKLHALERQRFDRAEAARLYADGLSTPEIGQRLGVHHTNVYRALRALGVVMRSPTEGRALARRRADPLTLYEAGR